MKPLRRAFRYSRTFLKEAWIGFYRARGMHALTVGIITASFAIMGGFLVVMENLHALAREWNRVQIQAYLTDEASASRADDIVALVEDLRRRPMVAEVRHVSREEAMRLFRTSFAELADAADLVRDNPFPASIEISIKGDRDARLEGTRRILEELKASELVEMVQDNEEDAQRLAGALGILSQIGFAIGATLAIASTFIVFNVIRLTVNARRDEITIMRLVGATPGFIRGPFLVEGMLQGTIGAIVALAALRAAHLGLADYARRSGDAMAALLSGHFLPFPRIALMALGGLLIGLIGSALSLRRFLAEDPRRTTAPRKAA